MLVALIAAVCPACLGGSAAPSARPDAGHVVGRVAKREGGGTSGSASTGEPRLVPVARAQVVITRRAPGAPLTRRLRADAHGRFRLSLPPGCYTVVAHIRPPIETSVGVCVRAGQTARVTLTDVFAVV